MELQEHLQEFEAAGVRLLAISPEPVAVNARGAQELAVTFPLVADEGSRVIDSYGILNTLIDPDERYYGIPFPGTYFVGTDGRVQWKRFNREYRVREAASVILCDGLGLAPELVSFPSAQDGVAVSAMLAAPDLKPYQRVPLLVRIDLGPRLHIYGEPVPDGYVATAVTVGGPELLRVEPPRYPLTRPWRVDGLAEQFHVFEGAVEIAVPLVYANYQAQPGDVVPVEVAVRYQACDERECFVPATARLHLDLPVGALRRRPA